MQRDGGKAIAHILYTTLSPTTSEQGTALSARVAVGRVMRASLAVGPTLATKFKDNTAGSMFHLRRVVPLSREMMSSAPVIDQLESILTKPTTSSKSRSKQSLPDELMLDIYTHTLPRLLKLHLSMATASDTPPQVTVSNLSDWRATRAIINLTPQLASLTGQSSVSQFNPLHTTLYFRFTNSTASSNPKLVIPAAVLGKFSRILVEIPISATDPNRARILLITRKEFVRFRHQQTGQYRWLPARTLFKTIRSPEPPHPTYSCIQSHLDNYITDYIDYAAAQFPEMITSASLQDYRRAVNQYMCLLRPANAWVFWRYFGPWQFVDLDSAVRHHERHRQELAEESRRVRQMKQFWIMVWLQVVLFFLHRLGGKMIEQWSSGS
jgi:hypothetical protein